MNQEITSAATTRNSVSAIVRLGDKLGLWDYLKKVLDIGGGKWNKTTEALATRGVESKVYDPYNRTDEENHDAIEWAFDHAEAVIISNVLNVITSIPLRYKLLQSATKIAPIALITVYEGDKSGKGKQTRDGWQENRRISTYIDELAPHYRKINKHNNILICTKHPNVL